MRRSGSRGGYSPGTLSLRPSEAFVADKLEKQLDKAPERVIQSAVKGMLQRPSRE